MQIEFVGQSVRDSSLPASTTGRLINWYREAIDGRSAFVLRSVLGQTEFIDVPGTNSYAMFPHKDRMFLSHNGALYRFAPSGTYSNIGALPEDLNTGFATCYSTAAGDYVLAATAQGRYFIWDGSTLTEPAAGAFSTFIDVAQFAGRAVLAEKGGRRLQWSAVNDPTSLGGLDFATAEIYDDDVLRLVPVQGSLWVFKEKSIERWYADTDGPRYINGSAEQVGLKAWGLLSDVPDGVFWIGSDGKAHLALAGGRQIVSTIAVETDIQTKTPERCVYWQDEGHEFVAIIFADRPAWVFDVSTSEWHERAEGDTLEKWDVRAIAKAPWGKTYAVNREGSVAELERTNVDRGDHMPRRAVGRTLENEGNRFRVKRMQFRANVGDYGNPSTQPDMLMRVSKDYGRTFGDWRTKGLGKAGEYGKKIKFPALGQYEAFTPEIAVWGPEDVAIEATAYVEVA